MLVNDKETNVIEKVNDKNSSHENTQGSTVELAAQLKPVGEKPKPDTFKKRTSNRPFNKGNNTNKRPQIQKELEEKIVNIARVTNVVKGGRRFSFSAVVVVGDKKGKVGFGFGKANEVPDAIKKAIKAAQNNLISVPIVRGITIPHEQDAKYLASKVLIKPAPKGKGIIASGSVRAVVELAGYTDIYTKTYGSRNKANTVKATFEALKKLRTVEEIAKMRDLERIEF